MNKVTFSIRLFLDAFRDTIKVINHFELIKIFFFQISGLEI